MSSSAHFRHRCLKIGAFFITSLLLPSAYALDAGPVAIHGAVSATSSYSDRYDYLGDTADSVSVNVVEVILNGNYRFTNGLRVAGQLYGYKLGDYEHLTVDFAVLDYSFNPSFGVRVGQVKHAFGLYGESQDLDMIRPFAFLPLDFYNKTARPFNTSVDGAEIYGHLRTGKGSIDYQLFAGWLPKIDLASPLIRSFEDAGPLVVNDSNSIQNYGGWVAWNTPLTGLRFCVSGTFLPSCKFRGTARSAASLAMSNSDSRLLPLVFPPGFWDVLVGGKPAFVETDLKQFFYSAEYTRGDWQFAAEASTTNTSNTFVMPILGHFEQKTKSDSYYGMVTWQASPKLQFGTYYALACADRNDRDGSKILTVPHHTGWLKDFAFATSYNLAPWWLIKGEVHLLDGTKDVGLKGNGDAATWKSDWTYFALKTTVTF